MNSHVFPSDPRFQELLAGYVLGDLDAAERIELEHLARAANFDLSEVDYSALEAAAGAVVTACASDALPAGLRDRLIRAGETFVVGGEKTTTQPAARPHPATTTATPQLTLTGTPAQQPRTSLAMWLGWLAAAAAIVIAAVVWMSAPTQGVPEPMTLAQFVQSTPDVVRSAWGDWAEPEIKGVQGEVVWSPSKQQGFMIFKGLPVNDPTKEQYQLWIVDERGLADATGQSARISGGVFNVSSTGEVVVPIDPALKVGKAQLFALTIEKPGGTWVSDMTRRVVAAAVK